MIKTGKEDNATSDIDKKIKTVSEPDKKLANNLKTTDNKNSVSEKLTKDNKSNISEKLTKASPHKPEKKLVPQKPEKVAIVQKSEDTREHVIAQKPSIPQMNGLCSASDLEKDKMCKTNT